MSNHWKVQTYCFPNTICFCLDCKNTENKQNKIKDRVHNAENLEIATEISEARNKNQTVESNKEVNWNKSTNEAFCISAQISYFCFSPSNIIPAHAEMSLDSEQLTTGVSKNPGGGLVLMPLSSEVL